MPGDDARSLVKGNPASFMPGHCTGGGIMGNYCATAVESGGFDGKDGMQVDGAPTPGSMGSDDWATEAIASFRTLPSKGGSSSSASDVGTRPMALIQDLSSRHGRKPSMYRGSMLSMKVFFTRKSKGNWYSTSGSPVTGLDAGSMFDGRLFLSQTGASGS